MIECLGVVDVKAWRFFVMERAAAFVLVASFGELDGLPNQSRQRRARTELIEEGGGKTHAAV